LEKLVYIDTLKGFANNEDYTHLQASKRKKNNLVKLDQNFYSELLSQGKNLYSIFGRRYREEEVQSFFEEALKFPYHSGFDFSKQEVFVFNKNYDSKNNNTPKFVKLDVPYVSSNRLFEHLLGDFSDTYTYALRKHEHSTIFVLDIDFRNQSLNKDAFLNSVKNTIEYLGSEPFFIEYSEKSESYHIYFNYGEYFSKTKYKNIVTLIRNKFGIEVEIKSKGDILRLPLSNSYRRVAGIYNPDERLLISPLSLYENIKLFNYSSATKVPWKLHRINGNSLTHSKNHEEVQKDSYSVDNDDFTYGKGTRWENQIRLAFALLYEDKEASFQDFIKKCEYWNDGTSKDMKLPEASRNKILLSTWNWCLKSFKEVAKSSSSTNYINDEKTYDFLIGSDDVTPLEDKEWKILEKALKDAFLRIKPGKSKGAFEKRFLLDSMITMEFLIHMDRFRKSNGYVYQKEEYEFLNKGSPIGDKLKYTIAKHFGIKNIKKVFNFLEQAGLILRIYNQEGYSHSYKSKRYSTHFSINYYIINSILYNKFTKFCFAGCQSGAYPYYIYNIANFSLNKVPGLNGKHLFERLEEVQLIKNKGKPPDN